MLLGLAGTASLGLTMMACYGMPPCEPNEACQQPIDRDAATTDAGPDGGSAN